MRVAVFNSKPYDRRFLEAANGDGGHGHELAFLEPRLGPETAALAKSFGAVCAFVNDRLSRDVLSALAAGGARVIALRCAGYNNVDVPAARELGVAVARVPGYSPHAVAEHSVALMLALNRKVYRAYNRVREGNFAIDGLLGFDMHGRTVGVVGTGKIGAVVVRIMRGFGCRVLAYDPYPNPDCERDGARYVSFEKLCGQSDIVTLHCPLTPQTHHLIDAAALERMRPGVTLINTSRGGLIDTACLIKGLKSGRLGAVGLDVYEEEAELFFEDRSNLVLQDDVLARLLTFPNVVVTSHQAFFTREAMVAIAETTLANVTAFERGEPRGENWVA